MPMLKLVALDEEDLAVISAHVQDAVMKVEHLDYAKASRQFILTMNRFAWDAEPAARKADDERRLSVLNFARVTSVKSHGHRSAQDKTTCCRCWRSASCRPRRPAARRAGLCRRRLDPARRRMHRGAAHRYRRRLGRLVAPGAPRVSDDGDPAQPVRTRFRGAVRRLPGAEARGFRRGRRRRARDHRRGARPTATRRSSTIRSNSTRPISTALGIAVSTAEIAAAYARGRRRRRSRR